jgi:hypothetical protein
VVRHSDDLYVRSYRGTDGAWFRHAQSARQGLIQAGGIGKDVTFADETDPAVNDQIDAAYRDKYRRIGVSYVGSMVSPGARAATVRLVPRLTIIRFCRDRQDIHSATSQLKPARMTSLCARTSDGRPGPSTGAAGTATALRLGHAGLS